MTARKLAEQERDRALRNLYVARTNLAGQALHAPSGLAQVEHFFGDWRGRKLRGDPRGWEWFYYHTLANQSELTLHGHSMDVVAVSWSPDGARLASAGFDRSIRLWDAATGKQLVSFPTPQAILSLTWRPDGRRLASADFPDGSIKIWDPVDGTCLNKFVGHHAIVWSVAWSPDGSRLASADEVGRVLVWEEAGDRPLLELMGTTARGGCVCWSPDGRRLAAANSDATVNIWDSSDGVLVTTLRGHNAQATAVAWDPKGTRLASLSRDQLIIIWDAETGKELRKLHGPQPEEYPGVLAWSPDGKRLALGRRDLTVAVWDLETGVESSLLRGHTGSSISTVCWSPDGRRLASSERGWNGTIKIWNVRSAAERPFLVGDGATPPTDLCFSPDSRSLATCHRDGAVMIWDIATHERRLALQGEAFTVRRVCWSPDGRTLASGDAKGNVHLWDVDRKQFRAKFPGEGVAVSSLSWSQDSRRVACGFDDSGVVVWDVSKDDRKSLGRPGMGVELRLQGDWLAAGESYLIKILDAEDGQEVQSWRNVEVTDNSPHWDPTGRRIASLSGFAVEVREAATGALPFPPLKHFRRVERFAWAPDGRQLVTCTEDNDLHLWDAVEGNPILTLRGPERHIVWLAWSPDGTRIVVCAADGKISIWDATPGFASERAPALLRALNARVDEAREDLEAVRLRAGVHARSGGWKEAGDDAQRLAQSGGLAVFQAGWWVADVPRPLSPSSRLLDPFDKSPEDSIAVRWYVSADDPNGFVPLQKDQPSYFTRLYAAREQKLEVHLEQVPELDAGLWLNGESFASHEPAVLILSKGWNTLAVRLEERTPSSSVPLRHGIGFYLRLKPMAGED